jgi:hypothetical protein
LVLDRASEELAWPPPEVIFNPAGIGAAVEVAAARQKLGTALRSMHPSLDFDIGILASDPATDRTESPLALVCRFATNIPRAVLRDIHRLAWNYSRTPLLITVEPTQIRAWTCCEPPVSDPDQQEDAEIVDAGFHLAAASLESQVATRLHWLNLLSGSFFENYKSRFDRDRCADRLLLGNLTAARARLLEQGLTPDTCHDLLARLIFIQFLFDRKDSAGAPALTPRRLEALYEAGVLSNPRRRLSEILRHHSDTYAFFRWLNDRFNGDLFPGAGRSQDEREAAWAAEQREVTSEHLALLADFVEGRADLNTGQAILWRHYAFDVIPLEFISSIYEEFVSQRAEKTTGTVYTPAHVVDLILDRVLPWESSEWDVRVLDPACGSGIFLVKAFQRIIHRWRKAHGEDPRPADLRRILERNLFGFDIDAHAVRVASFSLYLEMCDNIDPRHYWSSVRFPVLRGVTLVARDFFQDRATTLPESEKFDLVVGNAPWGRDTAASDSIERLRQAGWPASYGSLGPLFIPESAGLVRTNGIISMIQEAGLLTKLSGPASTLRRKLFRTFAVDEIINLSALRFGLFEAAVSPACIVTLRPTPPDGSTVRYICPKSTRLIDDEYRIIVDPYDVHDIELEAAEKESTIWATLMWGSSRVHALVRRMESLPTLKAKKAAGEALARQGIKRGKSSKREEPGIDNMPLLGEAFPADTFKWLDSTALPRNTDIEVHRKDSTDFSAFQTPQLLVKRSWTVDASRFRAAIVPPGQPAALCTASYLSVHADAGLLEQLWAVYSSSFAVFWLFTHSARFSGYRPEANVEELLSVPIPMHPVAPASSYHELDRAVFAAFELRTSDIALVDDTLRSVTDYHRRGYDTGTKVATTRANGAADPLVGYAETFAAVLNAMFGKRVMVTLFDDSDEPLPFRVVAVHLVSNATEPVRRQRVESKLWRDEVARLSRSLNADGNSRVARIYDTLVVDHDRVPSVILMKPDRERYWTSAMAMRDADGVASDLLLWRRQHGNEEIGAASDVI